MYPSIRAVLFDADGVIVHPYRFRAWLEREHAITPAMTAPFFNGVFSRECLVGQADLAEAPGRPALKARPSNRAASKVTRKSGTSFFIMNLLWIESNGMDRPVWLPSEKGLTMFASLNGLRAKNR